jgi:UDP-glucuronate decarboxylase
MKALVTGGAGFIGSNLCRRLLNMDYEVVCLDNFYSGKYKNIEELLTNNNFVLIEHDVREPFDIKCDIIFNLACPASPPFYQKDPIYTSETNYLGMRNVLNCALKYNAKVLQASTSEVYGNPDENHHPQKEDYSGNVNPNGIRSCYDEGKRIAE